MGPFRSPGVCLRVYVDEEGACVCVTNEMSRLCVRACVRCVCEMGGGVRVYMRVVCVK